MLQTSRPGDDDRPEWVVPVGAPLVPGVQAWERLGVGLRCETWLAWSSPLWCPVVVKLARPDQVCHPRARASLRRESTALGRLRHPAAPRLLGDGTDAPVPYVVTEHLDGPTLDEAVDDHGPLAPADAAHVAARLLSVLTALHGSGLAHLDVKPENVVLVEGRAVLLDFGSARPLGHRQPAGRPVGTEGYAAPEMERCEPVAPSMDVYGVGMCLLEALTGATGDAAGAAAAAGAREGRDSEPVLGAALDLLDDSPTARTDAMTALHRLHAAGAGPLWPDWAIAAPFPRATDLAG